MKTHRFVGATSREVLQKVKQALGDDALIVSNRPHGDGIEVVALAASDMTVEDAPKAASQPQRAPAASRGSTIRATVDEQPEERAAFLDFIVRRNDEQAQPAAPAAARAPAADAPATPAPAPVAAAPAPAIAAAPSVAPVAVAHSAPSFATAVTTSTTSPSIITPVVVTRPASSPSVVSFVVPPAAPAPAAPAAASAPAASAPFAARVPAAPSFAGSPAGTESPAATAQNIDGILSEIQSLKAVLQRDIASLSTFDNSPAGCGRSGVMHELLNAGFSSTLSRAIAEDVCSSDIDPTIDAVADCLEAKLNIAETDEIITRGGVYALVGPTGVGKTTTVAKIAARAVVRYGASKVALLTTDSYRVGAHDQLRIYGRILSVPVHAIRDAEELVATLAELKDRHLILIDTVGMSQKDRMLAEQAAVLAGCPDVKRLLLVQSTANARTLEQVATAYRKCGIDGCILTKTDEAASIAPALDVVIRHQLPLHYVTDGQRVPEDLQLPDAAVLARAALAPAEDEVFDIGTAELAFMMPTAANRAHAGVAHV